MSGIDILEHHFWQPLAPWGLTGPLYTFNATVLLSTWLCMLIIVCIALVARYYVSKKNTIGGFIAASFVRTFMDMVYQSCDKIVYKYYAFIASLFVFIIVCNCSILVGIHEPTTDVNTTFALGITSFLFVQKEAILAHGLWGYIKHYFKPFFFMAPLEILSKITSIISLSFRLFGNIFGGSLILSLWAHAKSGSVLFQILGIISGLNIITMLFFGIFEGFIQAFVFSVLSLTYLAMNIQHDEEHV